jgi:hypothetical protein
MGAVVVLACFVAGVNYAYRWVFLLWPAFWMWRRLQVEETVCLRQRIMAGIGCGLVALAFWEDGLFCVVINAFPPRNSDWVNHAQLGFRLWTQPLQWLLMALLAGWLCDGVLSIIRSWRQDADAAKT